jgi:hypothetical protein
VGAGSDRLGDVAGIADAAVGDQRHARALQRSGHAVDRHDLRHADTGDDARGADRAWANADLDAVGAAFHQRQCRRAGGDVAADHVHTGVVLLDPTHALDHAGAVAVGGVDHQHVDAGARQQFDTLFGAFTDTDRGADAQLAESIARRVRKARLFGDVFHRHQATQFERVVDDQHPLQLVAVHQRLAFFERSTFAHRDQALARRHDLAHRRIEPRLEPQVTVGDDADHRLALQHRETRHAVQLRQLHHLAHRGLARDRDRVAQQARFVTLDPRHFGGLLLRRQVLVDDADAAFLRDGDRQARFGHRVHGGRHQRQVQADVSGEVGRKTGVAGQHLGERWHQQHIVEGERFAKKAHGKSS